MTQSQTTIWNRTEMHSGIRGATELLQQEVGQAGRVSVPGTGRAGRHHPDTAVNAVGGAARGSRACDPGTPTTGAVTVQVSSTSRDVCLGRTGLRTSLLTTLDGDAQESIKVAAFNARRPPTITACFTNAHAAGTVLVPMGGFATGIIPPPVSLNGSTATVLKLYGDINGDGNMVYVEYTCDTAGRTICIGT